VDDRKKLKSKKTDMLAQKYQQTVRGIHVVSPEEENEGYGGKDLQKKESFKPGLK